MLHFSFAGKFFASVKIKIFNYGKCRRDFTYIDDIVHYIREHQRKSMGRMEREYGFEPKMDLRTGLRAFAEWYKEYYRI